MPSFAMPLQLRVTSDRLAVWVMAGDGQILLGLPHPGPDGLSRLEEILAMANRHEELCEALAEITAEEPGSAADGPWDIVCPTCERMIARAEAALERSRKGRDPAPRPGGGEHSGTPD